MRFPLVQALDPQSSPRVHALLDQGTKEGVAPGFVAGYWSLHDPDVIKLTATGLRRRILTPQPMGTDTVFDLASLSKVLATATLVAAFVERGWLEWTTPLQRLLPDYPYPDIRMDHLLSHTAGLVWWSPFYERIRERAAPATVESISISVRQAWMRELVYSVPPEARPGERAVYSDLSFLLLGFALEELTGMPLDEAVKRFLWNRMDIQGLHYRRVNQGIESGRDEAIAATENCPWRGGVVQGQVHDDNTWAMGGYAGHAGVFGSAQDVLTFASRLMSGFLSESVTKRMWDRVAVPTHCSRTLGWDTPSGDLPGAGSRFSSSTVGHTGFTGTSLWIDRNAGLAAVLLSNRVHPTRENPLMREFRPKFHDALRMDLGG